MATTIAAPPDSVWPRLGVLPILGALAGIVAAIGPARRASRIDALQAPTQH
jgi:hypothetical protein